MKDFDHHCIWINNCIGGSNYRWFVVMITAAAINIGAYLAAALYVNVLTGWPVKAASVTVWIIGIVCAVLLVLDLHLVGLHIYLNCKSMSTLDLIIER